MSESDKERASVSCGGGGGAGCGNDGGDDEEDGRGGGVIRIDARNKQKGCGNGHGRNLRKASHAILCPLGKAKSRLLHRRRNKGPSPSSFSSAGAAAATASCSGSRVGDGCCLCFTQPRTSESPVDSPTSDPNNPEFTYELLKTLIEKNDFYSRECNPHLNVIPSSTD